MKISYKHLAISEINETPKFSQTCWPRVFEVERRNIDKVDAVPGGLALGY
jgi:hypothetical protein